MPCCIWRSAVRIYLDVEVMQKLLTNNISRIWAIADVIDFYVEESYR